MPNTLPCGKCQKYSELFRPTKTGKVSQKKGHCLHSTIYASNRIGSPVYPVGANIQELPHGLHKRKRIHEDSVVPTCSFAKEKI